jgi:hypothetical protein
MTAPLTDPRLLLMSAEDNCLIAATPLSSGETLRIEGADVILPLDVGLGHKVARFALAADTPVLRYGAVIGTTTAAVSVGEHLHLHNLRSNYIETYTHDHPAGSRQA